MITPSARLARSITWHASKQTYLTACLLADRNLVDDCLRAYAYFRWADDQIDVPAVIPVLQKIGQRCALRGITKS